MSETIEQRFKREKFAHIWSDWCSSGVWDAHGVNVNDEWLPVSRYALSMIAAMQMMYDSQSIQWEDEQPEPYADEHGKMYVYLRDKATEQVKLELPDWDIR